MRRARSVPVTASPAPFPGGARADCVGYGLLPFVLAVLVDQSCAAGGVTHPLHQLAKGSPGVGRQVVAGVAQIVKMDRRQARGFERGQPHAAAEVGMPQRPAVRDAHGAQAGVALGWTERQRAADVRPGSGIVCRSTKRLIMCRDVPRAKRLRRAWE